MYRKLKGLLIVHGMTQQDLATILNLAASTLNFKINGKTDFTLKEAKIISNHFKVSIEEIFE